MTALHSRRAAVAQSMQCVCVCVCRQAALVCDQSVLCQSHLPLPQLRAQGCRLLFCFSERLFVLHLCNCKCAGGCACDVLLQLRHSVAAWHMHATAWQEVEAWRGRIAAPDCVAMDKDYNTKAAMQGGGSACRSHRGWPCSQGRL